MEKVEFMHKNGSNSYKKVLFFGILALFFFQCGEKSTVTQNSSIQKNSELEMNQQWAEKLVQLPLHCVEKEYPNKLGQVLNDSTQLKGPKLLHPTFYGCFDWHSAVHGYWLMVRLLKEYPDLASRNDIRKALRSGLTSENISIEIQFFEDKLNSSFERTYGWAWLLKLQQELDSWENDAEAKEWANNLHPLSDMLVNKYETFLPKLHYPIRTGEHSNTAFGLSFAYDYAVSTNNISFMKLIEKVARKFYLNDVNAPISWEPSGYDFISPTLEEANLMCKILPESEFIPWFETFLPNVNDKDFSLEVGVVSDRTDGKLVHLDGLNFSRAWAFYAISHKYAKYAHLSILGDKHLNYSLPSIIDGDYMGEHWLGSFAAYALLKRLSDKK